MAAEWMYQCLSHDPPLAEHWDSVSRTTMVEALEHRDEIAKIPSYVWDHLDHGDVRHWLFLRMHYLCTVQLTNEYGQSLEEWEKDKKF